MNRDLNPLTNLMKLVDILLVLSVAATANAILISAGNDGSLQASGTFSQVSGPTNEPNPQIPDEDWQEIMDIIHSKKPNQDQQQPIDELSSDIFNQVSVPTNEPIPQIPDDDWQEIMDIIHSNIPGNQQYSTDEVNSSTSNQDQQNPIDQPSQSTSNQDQQQPMNEADSASTSSSRMIILKEKYQRTFDRLRKRLELSKKYETKTPRIS
ncbi:hypothetical protein BDEG_25935 [Batrachochytrium dendrobatidis JEL423]|uniref:Uncharacterized protein n=1 Tax=Batrachochytrium dendrobatidis (strain JEL423) TaxID=403673 RepID=A0A177WQV9_BATDL|nr:hypothetical protein BDEG_25935 [Batrachochytrium dendrobatidis JEL423]